MLGVLLRGVPLSSVYHCLAAIATESHMEEEMEEGERERERCFFTRQGK
jgi:hypothetical protein